MRTRDIFRVIVFTCLCVSSIASDIGRTRVGNNVSRKILFRELRDSECKVKCKSRKARIMCGSDGVSYQSKCELKRARRCEGKKVTIKKKGKCSEKDVPMTKCFQEKEEAIATVSRSGATNIFIPECNDDGTFAEVQCHKPSNYCWCVLPSDGKPLARSSKLNGRPNCKEKSKRRKPKNWKKNGGNKGSSKSKKCTKQEKRRFNFNLVKVFTEEYNRSAKTSLHTTKTEDVPLVDTIENRVVVWKFSQYDTNGDNHLTIKEVNALRRLVKKYIKPKSCAKRFLKFCDPDKNKLIERREWISCLGVDINNEKKEKSTAAPEVNPSGESLNSLLNKPPSPHSATASSTNEPGDCPKDRILALEQEVDNPDAGIFIPNCTPDGKWTRAQCHKGTGYCWCVEENTGRPISGTSTQGVEPECDFEGGREIEGCDYADKQSFLADLLNVLKSEMTEYALNNNTDHSRLVIDPDQSLPERAVMWRFAMLDTNRNTILESDEIESFKKTSLKKAQKKQTRKCARKFVRYCDEDGDKQITADEWVTCLGVSRNGSMNLPANPKRTGKNPFDEYLHDRK